MSFQPSKYTSCGPYFRQPSSHPVLQPPRTGYLTIRVLIFEWDQNDPILQIDPELAELEKLFREEYRFDVKRVKMGSYNPEGDVQAALLRMFDQTTDVRDPSLLIIFYNGHGVETYSRERTRYEMKWGRDANLRRYVNWTQLVDGNHFQAQGDILMIFDCCFSGNARHSLCSYGGFEAARNVQALVGADEQHVAYKAFPGAFTRLLMKALRSLKGQTFTPTDLLAKVERDKMRSQPYCYSMKGRASDMKIGWLDPARAHEREFEAYGDDLGFQDRDSKAMLAKMRQRGPGRHGLWSEDSSFMDN